MMSRFTSPALLGGLALAGLLCEPALAQAPAAPTPDKGDTAWMLVATCLVLMMSVPGLALFYGGLVRTKNMLSVLTQVFAIVCLVCLIWVTYGYSLAFTNGGGLNDFVGGFSKAFLAGVDATTTAATFSNGVVIPELVYVCFQMTFAMITPALIVGAFAERMKFSALVLFMVLWVTFIYFPMAHMVWYWGGPDVVAEAARGLAEAGDGAAKAAAQTRLDEVTADAGLIFQWGGLDFAGGTVVHINAGIAGLVGCLILGKRIGYGRDLLAPHSLTMTMIGASLLWVGWFGFNAGSNLEANGTTALAMMNTFVATAAAALAWLFVEWGAKGKPSLLGLVSGAIAGLVAVTPASGFAGPMGSIVLGLVAGAVCYLFVANVKYGARLRRHARRVRHPLHRRHHRRPGDGHPGQPGARRRRHPGLRHQARRALDRRLRHGDGHVGAGQGRAPDPRLVRHRLGDPLQDRRPDRRPPGDARRGARGPRPRRPRRARLQLLNASATKRPRSRDRGFQYTNAVDRRGARPLGSLVGRGFLRAT